MFRTINDEIEASAVREMRRQLQAWLARKDWEMDELVNWLRGEGLPASDIDQEPYAWLLDGLPLADKRYDAEVELASRAASLLAMQPDMQPRSEERDKWLYNLLMLCAGLSCATQLADQLHAMFLRRQLIPAEIEPTESLQTTRLTQALESALITNQADERMREVWLSMIEHRGHDDLTGDEYAGFEGIRLMSASSTTRGEPALDEIGDALAMMARHLDVEHEYKRRAEFYNLIERVLRTYPGRPTWDSDLVRLADEKQWPDWAVSSLPNMFVWLASDGERHTVLVSEVYLVILRASGVEPKVEGWLCQDSILKGSHLELIYLPHRRIEKQMARVVLLEDSFFFLQEVAIKMEGERLRKHALELHSYKKVIAIAIGVLSELKVGLRNKEISGYGMFTPETIQAACDTLRIAGLQVMTSVA
jgi:hypothetical protein